MTRNEQVKIKKKRTINGVNEKKYREKKKGKRKVWSNASKKLVSVLQKLRCHRKMDGRWRAEKAFMRIHRLFKCLLSLFMTRNIAQHLSILPFIYISFCMSMLSISITRLGSIYLFIYPSYCIYQSIHGSKSFSLLTGPRIFLHYLISI